MNLTMNDPWMLHFDAADERLSYSCPQEVDRSRMAGRGLVLKRFPRSVEQSLQGQLGPLANVRSSSGCIISFKTDSPWVVLQLSRLRHHQYAAVGIDCEVYMDNPALSEQPWWHLSASPDLRTQTCGIKSDDLNIRFATGLERGKEPRRVLLHLPLISTCAVAGIKLMRGAQLEKYQLPAPRLLAIGDSLTQGFCVQSPTQHWLHALSRHLDMPAMNLGIGGIGFHAQAFTWALEQQSWDLVTVALGSNHAWNDTAAASCMQQAEQLFAHIDRAQVGRVVCLLPPWKPMCAGLGPPSFMGVPLDHAAAQRLQSIQNDLRQFCAQRSICCVDGLLPEKSEFFVDGLHPSALGMDHYAQRIIEVIEE